MKTLYSSLLILFAGLFANAQDPSSFIMTFEAVGTSNYERTVTLATPYLSNFSIDFGDGTVLNNQTTIVSHVYNTSGTYTVSMSGNFGSVAFTIDQTYLRLRTIEQWGDNQWTNMAYMFAQCTNLVINAMDTPDLSQVTSLNSMFTGCTSFNSPLNNWDVSNVTDIGNMFYGASEFNQPLNNWDVSNVTHMAGVFWEANSFNQPLNNWNVSNVERMDQLFQGATAFNQSLDNWDVSNIYTLQYAFYEATSFNQPLNSWDVHNVETFTSMFGEASAFNQPLDNWDVSGATDFSYMFWGATAFNEPINSWDVSNAVFISNMFGNATAFNQPLDNWDLTSAITLDGLFTNATSFNQPLNAWNTSNIEQMISTFNGATSFNQPLDEWDMSNVVYTSNMFSGATAFNQPLDNWNVSNVINMSGMFNNATSFNQDLSEWDFNFNIQFGLSFDNISYSFLRNTALSIENYEAFLISLIDAEIQTKYMGVHGLFYCDSTLHTYLTNELGWNLVGDSQSEECVGNTLTGTILFDENANGCSSEDSALANVLVSADNGDYSFASAVGVTGEYNLLVQDNTYTISLLNLPPYFTATPATSTVSFESFGNTESVNFCLTANETINDLNVSILPLTEARPGFEATYQLVATNIGTQTISNVALNLAFDTAAQTFVSATETADTATTGQVGFAIASLQPFETKVIDIVMQTLTPPIVNGDDILNFTATITPDTNDNTPGDNTFTFNQTVVNSYDPNDKQVVQGNEIYLEQAGDYLHYIIRFQNTGTASAIKVRIADELSDKLDWATLTPISASHNYRVQITDGNQVEYIFDNINLPAQQDDDAGSNGYIAYKIKPVQGLEVGNVIEGNEASIYFDYNLPIVTNAVATEIINTTQSAPQFEKSTIKVFPNPFNDVVHIQNSNGTEVISIKIYTLEGRELLAFPAKTETINLKNLGSGIYIMAVESNNGNTAHKIIKN